MKEPLKRQDRSDPSIYHARQMREIASRWDRKAGTWDKDLQDPGCHLNEDEAYGRFLANVLPVIIARREVCSARGLIDYGCGTGLVLAEFLPYFAWGLGIDISPEMVKAALGKQLPKARFICADLFEHPENGLKAGAVVSRGVLLSHYGEEQGVRLLQAGWKALLQGGFLVFDFLNRQTRSDFSHFAETKTYFSAAQVMAMAKSAGFSTATILGEDERRILLLFAEKGP